MLVTGAGFMVLELALMVVNPESGVVTTETMNKDHKNRTVSTTREQRGWMRCLTV